MFASTGYPQPSQQPLEPGQTDRVMGVEDRASQLCTFAQAISTLSLELSLLIRKKGKVHISCLE